MFLVTSASFVLLLVAVTCLTVDPNGDCSLRPGLSCHMSDTSVGECNITTGICSCNQSNCFVLNSSSNYCVDNPSPCYSYENGTCYVGRRRRTVAIVLSIFLLNFGAANFYIERYALAIPQIILGLALCLFQFGSCAVAGSRDEDTSVPCIVCCSINSVISLTFLAWWIADLIIFATNSRPDGLNCPLI
jgi:hypothetical protein